jgi:Transposase
MRFIGLDLHKRALEVCILSEKGTVLARHSLVCEHSALKRFAQEFLQETDKLAVEATTNTWVVAAILRPFVAAIVVGNPLQIKAIAQAKVKTDKIDAEVLANLLRCDFLPDVWNPDPQTQRLRHLTGVRSALVADRTRLKNRIHSTLAGWLIVLPEGGLFTQKGLNWVRQLQLPDDARSTVDRFLRLYDAVEAELEALDVVLRTLGASRCPSPFADDIAGCGSWGCLDAHRGTGRHYSISRWRPCCQLPGSDADRSAICWEMLSWFDHQGWFLNFASAAQASGPAHCESSRPPGSLLPTTP